MFNKHISCSFPLLKYLVPCVYFFDVLFCFFVEINFDAGPSVQEEMWHILLFSSETEISQDQVLLYICCMLYLSD